jgi:hypothetical protein
MSDQLRPDLQPRLAQWLATRAPSEIPAGLRTRVATIPDGVAASDRRVVPFRPRGNGRTWALVLVAAMSGGLLAYIAGGATPTTKEPTSSVAPAAVASIAATPTATPVAAAACRPMELKLNGGKLADLTGSYAADDGGIYYVRQRGNVIWWSGMSARDGPPDQLGRDWNNVGRGVLGNDLTIKADWVDVPRGEIMGYGTVDFKIIADGSGNMHLIKTSETGTGRGDDVWTPCTLVR